MITKDSFTRSSILRRRESFDHADPLLIERQIYAFELLGLLRKTGKKFVFKGGTSMILLLPRAKRLSIDIDIIGDFSYGDLTQAAMDSVFIRVEEDVRQPSRIPKKHFKFYYHSAIDERQAYVLLDILYGDHGYPRIQELPIRSRLFTVEQELTVSVPTVDGILGDKLTAFAPGTIGIPFGKGKSMEIIKQLYDVGELFDACGDINMIIQSYRSTHQQESAYQGKMLSIEETTNDTIDASLLISQVRLRGGIENEKSIELEEGIRQIQGFLLGGTYRLDDARVSASKAAILTTMVKMNKWEINLDGLRYNPSIVETIATAEISNHRRVLNRLKAIRPEAFYYWWKTEQLERGATDPVSSE